MLLRISLGIAILAGVGALYYVQVPVNQKLQDLTTNLQTAESERTTAEESDRKSKADATKARADLDTTRKDLNEKTSSLENATAKLSEQQTRANQLDAELTKTKGERNEAQQEISAWRATGMSIDQVQGFKTQVARLSEERDAIAGENKILLRNTKQLQVRLDKYEPEGDTRDPEMPVGLKGKVLAVDSKYDFVVLDIGGNKGAVERGKLLISREGKLVGAVRITRVEPDRCIANIIPEMKQGDIVEGDIVLY